MDLREWELVDHHGADGVEEDLEGAEKGLSKDGVEEESLERGWEVGVDAINAQGFMMGKVIGL